MHRQFWLCALLTLCWFNLRAASSSPVAGAPNNETDRTAFLARAGTAFKELIFCTRLKYNDPHWYANIGYYCDNELKKAYTGNGRPDVGKLYKLNLRTGRVSVLLDARGGSIRDPQVHYDGRKILFSWRKAGSDCYHLHEIGLDGAGLRQLTTGDFDDFEPAYLPDGGIAFVSTRCKRWVNCWMTQVAVIYRCNSDGGNIQLLSANTEHDNTPWVLPDGRILYTRWEYVDRSQVEFHHLWAMNPDGTGQAVFYGNMHPNIVMIDAKPVPGSDKIIASFSPGHGVNEHAGIATLVTAEKGPDDRSAARALHKGKLTRDPYPLSENLFLAARDNQIVWFDGGSQMGVLYTHPGEGLVHEPRPVMSRPRERIIAPRADLQGGTGLMVLADVYQGRNLVGVRRGDIKKLLVLESLPKPVNFSGGPDLVSWLGTFTLERVLGTIPVEADGSAFFEVPADRQLFFVALDEKELSVKRMQSFTTVRPGEVLGCVGCHELRTRTPESLGKSLLALRRPPSKIQAFEGYPDVLDFTRDIQPILDKHCVACHTYDKCKGSVLLAGDVGPNWSHSYFSLFAHRLVADGRNGLGNQLPRTIGSSASRLLRILERTNYQVSPREWRTTWLWIESGAPYAGTYAALRNEQAQERAAGVVSNFFRLEASLLQRRCHSCHTPDNPKAQNIGLPFNNELRRARQRALSQPTAVFERVVFEHDPIARFSPNILLNFSRPRLSPLLLGPLAASAGGFGSCGSIFNDARDPDYQELLQAIQEAKAQLDVEPRFAAPGFRPNRQYVREMKKFGLLPAAFDISKEPLDFYVLDQKYWRSFWRMGRNNLKTDP